MMDPYRSPASESPVPPEDEAMMGAKERAIQAAAAALLVVGEARELRANGEIFATLRLLADRVEIRWADGGIYYKPR